MAFRIETRQEMLSGFRYAAIIEEQKQFGYFLGSWVFSDVDDAARAADSRKRILDTNNVKENDATRYVVEKVLSSLDDSAWRWYEWATKWTLYYAQQGLEDANLDPLIENLITQVNQGSANHTRMQSQEQYSQWDPETLKQWNEENNQGDRLQGSKFYKNNVIYKFENGWTMVRLEDERDYVMIGEKLKNCTRYEAPSGWKNHPGMIALVDPEGNPKAVARFGNRQKTDMNICYEFRSQRGGLQRNAKEYGEYLFEFLNKTTPEELGFEGETWENKSPVKPLHEIAKRYQQGERDFQHTDLRSAYLTEADLTGADLSGANLTYADLRSANLTYTVLHGAELYRADLTYADLTGAKLESAKLEGANLRGAKLENVNLSNVHLSSMDLSYANLNGADLSGANLYVADLSSAILRSANLIGALLYGANLWEADLSGANLTGANLTEANLRGAYLWGAVLHGANLHGAMLSSADLTEADLTGAKLESAKLEGANLYGAILRSADLIYANLKGANLNGADLSGAKLLGAILWGANLKDADLESVNLTDANLKGAKLHGANLTGAKLESANLIGVNLRGAKLWEADLSGANLKDADLTEAVYDQSTKWPEGFTPPIRR